MNLSKNTSADNIVIKIMGEHRNTDIQCFRVVVVDKSLDADEITKQVVSLLHDWGAGIEKNWDIKCIYKKGCVDESKHRPRSSCDIFYVMYNAYLIK